jgi:oxygen-independent coproporphyrinogen-3 oxidase
MTAAELYPVLGGSPYRAYVYAYPHKTAYRRLDPVPLRAAWAAEPRSELFLYVHVPFCAMRCGFCNLFTTANPKGSLVAHYLDALSRQAEAVRAAIPDATFARFAIGGGTPTYLDERELGEVFDLAARVMGADPRATPTGVEASPDTLTRGKVELLKSRGVDRVSIGVQSFIESEAANSGRPQTRADVDAALSLLAAAAFPTFNIDLIYGLPGQTVETWLYSVREALQFSPEELYLYPLYVRPLTGLGRSRKEWDDVRLACYRDARDLLLAEGYEQVSMRMFRKSDKPPHPRRSAAISPPRAGERCWAARPLASLNETRNDPHLSPSSEGERSPCPRLADTAGEGVLASSRPTYCCQEDGMIGLGCGARSYTRSLHYSLDYAVSPKSVKEIIADYLARTPVEFATAEHGFALDANEQRRRYLLQSILHADGLDAARYAAHFGTDPADDFADLRTFADLGLVVYDSGKWFPTPLGLERSDALGPWFFSRRVRELMAEYEAK